MISLVELKQRETDHKRQAARQRQRPRQRSERSMALMHLAVSRVQPAAACIGFCLVVSVRFKTSHRIV